MFAEVHIVASKSDIEDCHRLGKNGITTVQFVNRKFCNGEKNWLAQRYWQVGFGFGMDTTIYAKEI